MANISTLCYHLFVFNGWVFRVSSLYTVIYKIIVSVISLDDILIRKSPPDYQDGVYEPAGQDRPNPFHISDTAHSGESGLPSQRGRTAMLVFFGNT